MNDSDNHLLLAPVRTTTQIPGPTRDSRKLVIAFEPQREFAGPVTHLHHSHDDASLRPDARVPVKVLVAAATPAHHHRHWGINE